MELELECTAESGNPFTTLDEWNCTELSSRGFEVTEDLESGFKTKSAWRKERKKGRDKFNDTPRPSSDFFQEEEFHLHFPASCELSNDDKRDWFEEYYEEFGGSAVLKRGANRLFIVCDKKEVFDHFVKTEYGGIKLESPGKEKKIIIKNFPLYDDPEIFLRNDSVKWVRRIMKYGVPTKDVLAGIVGNVPYEIVDFPGKSYSESFKVVQFSPEPIICFRCSKWGHFHNDCMGVFHCRYCAGNHDSRVCGDKIKRGIEVPRKCANCFGNHNASSILCNLRPGANLNSGSGPKISGNPPLSSGDFPPIRNKNLEAVKGTPINGQGYWSSRQIDHSTPSQDYGNKVKEIRNPWG